MINNDRIVPIKKIDYLSMIGTMLTLAGTSYGVLQSEDVEGTFKVTGSGSAGNKLANQPVKTLDFASGVTGAVVYFCAAYDYKGMTIAGVATTPTGDINADGITLYKATLDDGAVTVVSVTP